MALIADHDRRFTCLPHRGHQSGEIHAGHFHVVGFVLRPTGNILDAAIAVMSIDSQLLAVMASRDAVFRVDGNAHYDRVFRVAERRSRSNPADDHAVFVGADLHAFAATVRQLSGGLEQEQTFLRRRQENTPTPALFQQRHVIQFGIGTDERQPEPVLSADFAVASTGIAAELGKDRHDLIAEVDRQIFVDLLGGGADGGSMRAKTCSDFYRSVSYRRDHAGGRNLDNVWLAHRVGYVPRHILQPVICQRRRYNQLRGIMPAAQANFPRMDFESANLFGLRAIARCDAIRCRSWKPQQQTIYREAQGQTQYAPDIAHGVSPLNRLKWLNQSRQVHGKGGVFGP
jgi:hypothetical protein